MEIFMASHPHAYPQVSPVQSATDTSLQANILMIWPDGTYCRGDEYDPADFAHMSDDYEIADMADLPQAQRVVRDWPDGAAEIADFIAHDLA
ncbi:hypothetical protein ADT71_13055 [Novosphingobium sp. ST904]|nr:hypothetical protein ADT71_13055 [Novosphingobium sp. ST904]